MATAYRLLRRLSYNQRSGTAYSVQGWSLSVTTPTEQREMDGGHSVSPIDLRLRRGRCHPIGQWMK